jgi:hypothetical protein
MRTKPDLDYSELAKRLRGQIEDTMREGCGPGIVTKFLVIAEVVDEEGTKWLHRVPDPDMVAWEQHGLIAFALDNMGVGWQSIASGTSATVIFEGEDGDDEIVFDPETDADEDDEGEEPVDV